MAKGARHIAADALRWIKVKRRIAVIRCSEAAA